ncbi:MAG: bifunctional 5,10-methylenetetrahydrofolate dehydrogenase/5,10-methenyltetrahydrofolate cyclohydrolase [Proteobacteria bacterium]|nr:bifunctional 5,10-methylenetetrahydrofolate dehydrogenase/5,10-methenyltetrahydrofolate cyclohydrolase [Pseudomonadota bacterium]
MSAKLLEGKPVVEAVLDDVSARVDSLKKDGIVPGLGTILVGDDPASAGYVRKKHETCQRVGIQSFDKRIPADAGQDALLEAVREFNENGQIDAYLIQNPVPNGFDFNEALLHLDPAKDGDGLHPTNLGKLVLQEPGPRPCTPSGILAMLSHYRIPVEGREVVVLGRGPTLGRPLALMLSLKQSGANAAVTVVHTGVPNIADYTRRADILIAAVGVPGFVTPDMVKPGSVVISGGISWEGKKLLPDVDVSVGEVAGWITARLGGVGPTTVALLLQNAVACAEKRASLGS